MPTGGRIAAIFVCCLVIAGLAAGAAQAAIRVTTTEGAEVARFASLSCRTDRAGFHGRGVEQGWRLVVRIQPFAGFKTYELEYGDNESAGAFFLDPPGGGGTFSNAQEPPPAAPRLTLGGAIHFPNGRKRIRIAFPITYDSNGDKPNIVRVVGSAKCTYPRER
jgi:hypothetical protein